MKRHIKLMPDYHCYPVWDMDDVGNIDPHDMGISSELVSSLERWPERFDAILNRDDPAASGFKTPEDELAFEREGLRLWESLKAEIGADYKITYFSTLEHRHISDENVPHFIATLR